MSSTVIPGRTPVKPNSLTGSRRRSVVRSASLRSGAATMAAKSGTPCADAQSGMPVATAAANSMTRSIGFLHLWLGWGSTCNRPGCDLLPYQQALAQQPLIILAQALSQPRRDEGVSSRDEGGGPVWGHSRLVS